MFRPFIGQSIRSYVVERRKHGVWGDNIEITALSECYSRPVLIYGPKHLTTVTSSANLSRPPIDLLYTGENHYDAIIRKSDPVTMMLARFGSLAMEI